MYQPPSDAGIRAPLLEGDSEDDPAGSAGGEHLDGSTRSGRGGSGGPQLWAPLEYEAMPRWRWVDWCRYLFYRCVARRCRATVLCLSPSLLASLSRRRSCTSTRTVSRLLWQMIWF